MVVKFMGNAGAVQSAHDAGVAEAEKRGLLNLASTPDALPHFVAEKNIELFTKHNVFTRTEMFSRLEILLETYNKTICIEAKTALDKYGIKHNRCIDDDLMIRFAYQDKKLMDFLGVEVHEIVSDLFGDTSVPSDAIMLNAHQYAIKKKNNKDKGQRPACGCMVSKDIGEYNTCPHLCEYCYANASKEVAVKNWKQHKQNEFGETIKGE